MFFVNCQEKPVAQTQLFCVFSNMLRSILHKVDNYHNILYKMLYFKREVIDF